MRIETFEQFRELLSLPIPAIACHPFQRRPDVAVVCRGYTMGQVLAWRRGGPYLGYRDGKIVPKPENWEDAVLTKTVYAEGAEEPFFHGADGLALFANLKRNSPGVVKTLMQNCDAASGYYLTPRPEVTSTVPPVDAEKPILADLASAYGSQSGAWVSNVAPQDREAELRVGTYSLVAWTEAQMSALKSWGFERDYSYPPLLWSLLRDANGEPLVPDELRQWVLDHIPWGVVANLVVVGQQFSEIGEVPSDFFGETKPDELLPEELPSA